MERARVEAGSTGGKSTLVGEMKLLKLPCTCKSLGEGGGLSKLLGEYDTPGHGPHLEVQSKAVTAVMEETDGYARNLDNRFIRLAN